MSFFKNLQLPSNIWWGVGVVSIVALMVWMSKRLYESSRMFVVCQKKRQNCLT